MQVSLKQLGVAVSVDGGGPGLGHEKCCTNPQGGGGFLITTGKLAAESWPGICSECPFSAAQSWEEGRRWRGEEFSVEIKFPFQLFH